MGLRLGLAAKEALNAQGKTKAKTFLHACSVDGIQVATGATLGNKEFTLEDRGEMYLILTDANSGNKVEARLTKEAMTHGKKYRELIIAARTMDDGSPEELSIKKVMENLLNWFRTAPDADIVVIKKLN